MIAIARKELRDALRNRWLVGYAVVLGVLGCVAAYAGLRGSGEMALQMFGRTTATLMNLCLLLSPLVAVVLGGASIAGERDRGTLDFLLAQPLDRHELLLGKYVGLFASLAIATLAGFAPAAVLVTANAGAASLFRFAIFPLLALVLIGAMLGIGILVSVLSRTTAQAQGVAIFLWFFFVVVYDLLLMGTLAFSQIPTKAVAALLLINPVGAARVLTVLLLEPDLYMLGPAGAYLVTTLSAEGTLALLTGILFAWSILPLLIACSIFGVRFFRRRGAVTEPATLSLQPEINSGTIVRPPRERSFANMQRKIAVLTLVLLGLFALSACQSESAAPAVAAAPAAPAGPDPAQLFADGKGLYKLNCVPCHGPGGKGDGPGAANLDPKPRDHTNPVVMDKISDKDIASTIQYGGAMRGMPGMPSHPHLKPQDIDSLVVFVRTLSHSEKVPAGQTTQIDMTPAGAPVTPVTGQ